MKGDDPVSRRGGQDAPSVGRGGEGASSTGRRAAAIRIPVRLTPRGGADRVDGVADGALRVRVAAPAVEGAANRALLRLLADELGVARGAVRLVSGETSRNKVVEVEAPDPARVAAHWPGLRG